MRIFKVKALARFAEREHASDLSLQEAIGRAERGIIDADMGSVSADELAALRKLAAVWLHTPESQIDAAIKDGLLKEIVGAHEEKT